MVWFLSLAAAAVCEDEEVEVEFFFSFSFPFHFTLSLSFSLVLSPPLSRFRLIMPSQVAMISVTVEFWYGESLLSLTWKRGALFFPLA